MILNPYTFETGRLVCTSGVMKMMQKSLRFCHFVSQSVELYLNADWGSSDPSSWTANDKAVRDGNRILAVYISDELCHTIWIITEAERKYTTICFPDEY